MPNRSGQYWKVFVYKDLKYNALFTRSLGWNGGDGVFTTGLPDGNIFWSFNDSFYGVINENRSRGNCSFLVTVLWYKHLVRRMKILFG